MTESSALTELTADIVAAFVSKNTIRAPEMPELIAIVYASLAGADAAKAVEEAAPELKPAVTIRKSITDDYLICLDDGKKFKSLKRHLALLGMTPNDYRAKWSLPQDYPMVAPGYAAKRSTLAKTMGLGKKADATIKDAEVAEAETAEAAPVDAPANDVKAPTRRAAAKAVAPVEETVATEPVEAEVEAAPAKRRGRPKKVA